MKKIILFIIVDIFICYNGFSQFGALLYDGTITFESNPNAVVSIRLDTNIVNNIWQIGKPNKLLADSAYSIPNAIITDTINPYPVNSNSFFELNITDFNNFPSFYTWGEMILSFNHKYETDSAHDLGYIMQSYDNGVTWYGLTDVIQPYWIINSTNLYNNQDTSQNGVAGFSGNSNQWKNVEVHWVWCMITKCFFDTCKIRFYFSSDNVNTNKGGWIIDNIRVRGYEVIGNVQDNSSYSEYMNFPNPLYENSEIEFKKPVQSIQFFNGTGKLVLQKNRISDSFNFQSYGFQKSLYIMKCVFEDGKIIVKKIVVE